MTRDFLLARLGPVFDAVGGDQMHAVAGTAHDLAGNVVGADPVRALGDSLGDRMLDDIPGLRCEADEQPRPPIRCAELGQDVARRNEIELRWALAFLELGR